MNINEYRPRRLNLPRTDYISFSKIKLILESPAYFWAGYGRGKFREPSKEMLESKRIDLLLLEPEAYRRNVVVSPFEDWRARESWKWRDETLKANPSALIISKQRAEDDRDLQESVMSHPEVQRIFADLNWLRHGYAMDPEFGLLHWEVDLRTNSGLVGDVKAVESLAMFQNQLERYLWYTQLGFYGHGNELIHPHQPNRDNKFFLVVEKSFPFRVKIFTLRGDYDLMADKIWRKGAGMIRDHLQADPHFQNRALWFADDYEIQDLAPTFKYVNYSEHAPEFVGLQLGG